MTKPNILAAQAALNAAFSEAAEKLAREIDARVYSMAMNTHANEGSAQPMPGLSKRAQEQLKPRKASAYSFAKPSKQGKK